MVTLTTQLTKLCQWSLNSLLPPSQHTHLPPLPRNLKSIAVIPPYFIGDTILASTFLNNLRRNYPKFTRIFWITQQRYFGLFDSQAQPFHQVVEPDTIADRKALLEDLNCDAVFILRYSIPWAIAVKEAGVRYRIGLDLQRLGLTKMRSWSHLLTHPVSSGTFDSPVHQIELYGQMLQQLGLRWDPHARPVIALNPEDRQDACRLLKSTKSPRFMLHITAGSPGKRWPLSHWATLLDDIKRHFPDATFLACGTQADRSVYETLEMMSAVHIENLCGQTSLRQTAALAKFSDMVITLDTSIAHIAAAVDTPRLVVLYGPTNFMQWAPMASGHTRLEKVYLDMPCRPCITRTCYHQSCLKKMTPDRVLSHVLKAFER